MAAISVQHLLIKESMRYGSILLGLGYREKIDKLALFLFLGTRGTKTRVAIVCMVKEVRELLEWNLALHGFYTALVRNKSILFGSASFVFGHTVCGHSESYFSFTLPCGRNEMKREKITPKNPKAVRCYYEYLHGPKLTAGRTNCMPHSLDAIICTRQSSHPVELDAFAPFVLYPFCFAFRPVRFHSVQRIGLFAQGGVIVLGWIYDKS